MTDSADDSFEYTDEQEGIIEATPAWLPVGAGAGTGKSTTIRGIIATVTGYDPADEDCVPDDPIPEDRILVVMFTDSDQLEMEKDLRNLFGDNVGVDVVNYHALGEKIRDDYAYELPHGPTSKLLKSAEKDRILKAIAETMDVSLPGVFDEPGERADRLEQIIDVAKSLNHSPSSFAAALPDRSVLDDAADLLEHLETNPAFDPDADVIQSDTPRAWTATQRALDATAAHANQLQQMCGESRFELVLASYLEYVASLCHDQQSFLQQHGPPRSSAAPAVLQFVRTVMSTLRGEGDGPSHCSEQLAEWGITRVPLEPAWWAVRALLYADELCSGFEAYEEKLTEMSPPRYDHQDQIRHAIELLEQPDICENETGQYDLVLADEFQDVSKIEFNLVKEFGETTPVVAVGDLDQNVFAFRGSRRVFFDKRFEDEFDPLESASLSEVFRARTQELLELPNRMGEHLDGYTELVSHYDKHDKVPEALQPIPSVLHTSLSSDDDFVDMAVSRLEALLVDQTDPLADANYEINRVLVGLRQGESIPRFENELDESGLTYRTLKGSDRTLPDPIQLRLNALRVALDVADEEATRQVLTTGFDIDADVLDGIVEETAPLLESFKNTDALTDAIERTQVDLTRLQATDGFDVPVQLLDECERVLDLSTPSATYPAALYKDLCDMLEDYAFDDPTFENATILDIIEDELEDVARPANDDDIDVVVAPVHSLKGDEGDVVIAPEMHPSAWFVRRQTFDLLQYAGAKHPDDLDNLARIDFVDRAEQQERRVLHVLLTRAKCQFHFLGWSPSSPLPDPSPYIDLTEGLPDGIDWRAAPRIDPYAELYDACPDSAATTWQPSTGVDDSEVNSS